MAQTTGKLTVLKAQRLAEPSLYPDGSGLYLQVTGKGAKSWIFRFMIGGRARSMGLGSFSALGLAEARAKAADCRRLRNDGRDPIEARKAERTTERIAATKAVTFTDAAGQFIKSHKAGWRNPKHVDQWTNTLATYAGPVFGALPVQAVDTTLVLQALEAIWTTKPETASRVRGRIEAVLDWATVRGYRQGENPARWRGHLDKLLPARSKVRATKHHMALPYADVPAFLARVRDAEAVSARALAFAILTAARTGEVLGARWEEIDEAQGLWTVPPSRMKAGKEHRVPLNTAASEILAEMRALQQPFVFPGQRRGKPLSNMAMNMTLRRLDVDVSVHGFRSSFRDWAAERSNFPSEVVEMALAHTIGSKVEAAYRRGDLFEKRRRLMEAWAAFCTAAAGGKVVAIGGALSAAGRVRCRPPVSMCGMVDPVRRAGRAALAAYRLRLPRDEWE